MSRRVKLVIVCEDLLHETFLRAFLRKKGFTHRELRIEKPEPGTGDAKQAVCESLPKELMAFRGYHGAGLGLIYVIDADNLSIGARRRCVDQACVDAGVDPPGNDERVFGVIPKWEIENWIAYLRDGEVDENRNTYEKYSKCESDIYPYAERLAEMCDAGDLPNPPPSLDAACKEYVRFKAWLSQR